MDITTVNNLISFMAMAITENHKEAAIFAAKGLDCPPEVKEHIINVITSVYDDKRQALIN